MNGARFLQGEFAVGGAEDLEDVEQVFVGHEVYLELDV